MPGLSLEEASAASERIRSCIEAAVVRADDQAIPITASLGVSCFPAPGIDNLHGLLKAADRALYQAKDSGRNRVVSATSLPPDR